MNVEIRQRRSEQYLRGVAEVNVLNKSHDAPHFVLHLHHLRTPNQAAQAVPVQHVRVYAGGWAFCPVVL